jgi:predicted transcriptional regulator
VTGDESHTPRLTVRVSPTIRAALEEIATAQGRRLGDVSREAFEEYIRRHAS